MIKQFYDIRSVVFARPYKNLPSDWFPSARFGFIPTQIFEFQDVQQTTTKVCYRLAHECEECPLGSAVLSVVIYCKTNLSVNKQRVYVYYGYYNSATV